MTRTPPTGRYAGAIMQLEDLRTKAELAVQDALGPFDGGLILHNVIQMGNAHLAGAHVADVLDLFHNGDLCLGWTEPFWDRYGEPLTGVLSTETWNTTLPDGAVRLVMAYVVLARALVEQGQPAIGGVELLARLALSALRERIRLG